MFSFKQYLLDEAEVNVSLDTEDPAGSLTRAKETLRKGRANPSAAMKQRQMALAAKKKEAKLTGDTDQQKITDIEQKAARMKMMAAREKEREQI